MINLCGNAIDWAATGSMIQGIGTLGGAIAVFLAATIGASAWKSQKRAEYRLEIAKQILSTSYRVQRGLARTRYSVIAPFELMRSKRSFDGGNGPIGETDDRAKRIVEAHVYYTRLEQFEQDRVELEKTLPMARALFGKGVEEAISSLYHQPWILHTYLQAYVDDSRGNDPQFTEKIHAAIFANSSKSDEISEAIESAIAAIENACIPALKLLDP